MITIYYISSAFQPPDYKILDVRIIIWQNQKEKSVPDEFAIKKNNQSFQNLRKLMPKKIMIQILKA